MKNFILFSAACVAVIGAFLLGQSTNKNASLTAVTSSSTALTAETEHRNAIVSLVEPKSQVWSCAMHPHIQQDMSGQCPICGMELVQATSKMQHNHTANSTGNIQPATIELSPEAIALADIQTTQVERQYPEAIIKLVGKLGYDETRIKSLTARFPMRIDDLFVSFVGVPVKQGEHLAKIYSPQLRIAQNDLLSAYRLDKNSTLTHSAKEKLRLWGLLPEQINDIIKRGTAQDEFELKAPISGIVVQKNVNNGDYLKTGQSLFTIVDLQNLWLSLEAFESDLTWLRLGQSANFSVDAYPGEIFNGNITFINPEINSQTRTVAVRVNVPNTHKKLKPGMFAKALVHSKIALAGKVYAPELKGKWISPMHPEIIKNKPGKCDICGMDLVSIEELGYFSGDETENENKNKNAPLVIPASAILHTGKRAIVYIQTQQNPPTFEGREIILGPRAGELYIVNNGLQAGDKIVSNGAFKIDSALQIQAKPSMMNPVIKRSIKIADKHKHESNQEHFTKNNAESHSADNPKIHAHKKHVHKDRAHKDHAHQHGYSLTLEQLNTALPLYFNVQNHLANDELLKAKQQLQALSKIPMLPNKIKTTLQAMQDAQTINNVRLPHFESLSNAILEAVNEHNTKLSIPVYQMFCPMAYPDRGANWLQQTPHIKNPYFGSTMLKCGQNKALLTLPSATSIAPINTAKGAK